MSATDVSATPLPNASDPPARPGPAARQGQAGTWLRVGLVCAILLGSAAVRSWQSRRIEAELLRERRRPPVDLATLPMTLGPWKGQPTDLDPMIARATGADQTVTRHYVNQDTGVAVDVIFLYGPAVDMYIHAPELCYPTAGYALVGPAEARPVRTLSGKAPFRSLVYSKGEGARAELQEVYYSWRYDGRWTPEIATQKHFERIPSMYKIQLARRVSPGEKRDVGNPCEAFLEVLLPEMERRMSAAPQAPAS